MDTFIIISESRDSWHPYAGYVCQEAGVEPGKTYATREEAERDAEKLTKADPADAYRVMGSTLR